MIFGRLSSKRIGSITTTDDKQDAVTHTSVEATKEGNVKIASMPFEEKTQGEKDLVRKIDLYLMLTIWLLYYFSYMIWVS